MTNATNDLAFMGLTGAAIYLAMWLLAGERNEAQRLAPKYQAQAEVSLADGSRVDLLSPTHAWEVDWADHWAEGVGQCLHYAHMTDRRPGLILLCREPGEDWRFLVRGAYLCGKYDIDFRVELTHDQKQRPNP